MVSFHKVLLLSFQHLKRANFSLHPNIFFSVISDAETLFDVAKWTQFFEITIPCRGKISHLWGCDDQKTFNLLTFDWWPETRSARVQNEMESAELGVTADETSLSETMNTNGFIKILTSIIHPDLMFLHWIWPCTGTGSTAVTGVSSLDRLVNHLKDSQNKKKNCKIYVKPSF